ncbi:MAG: 16S rRNA methyltransferase [Chloroflexi bacterium]|nr:16S rRNA methyltransferase [Chloroflexota bacterium]
MERYGQELARLVQAVRHSRKYAQLSAGLIAEIGARELSVRHSLKEAIKATKRKLHQVAGAYLASADYDMWLERLRAAAQGGQEGALRDACRQIMMAHASTRERLPILDLFYATTLAEIEPPCSVLDVACGLNPLSAPWMPLAPGAIYYAYDVYEDLSAFLMQALPLLGLQAVAAARDVLHEPPAAEVDLALVLKAVPCLDQIEEGAGARLLQQISARTRHMLVSFPTESLCGRRKGMLAYYEGRFQEMAEEQGWETKRFVFENEVVFLVSRGEGRGHYDQHNRGIRGCTPSGGWKPLQPSRSRPLSADLRSGRQARITRLVL